MYGVGKMNMISINFQNIVTIGLITYLGSAVVRFLESKTGVDIDMSGDVATFESPFESFGDGGKTSKRGKK